MVTGGRGRGPGKGNTLAAEAGCLIVASMFSTFGSTDCWRTFTQPPGTRHPEYMYLKRLVPESCLNPIKQIVTLLSKPTENTRRVLQNPKIKDAKAPR